MHKAVKITLISAGSLFGAFLLFLGIGFAAMAAGYQPEESSKPAATKPAAEKSSAKPTSAKPTTAKPTTTKPAEPTKVKTTPKPTKTKLTKVQREAAQVRALRSALARELGTVNREGVKRLSTVKLDNGQLTVKWAIDDNLTENMIKTGARLDVQNILKTVKASDVDASVIVLRGTFAMQDAYGNASEDVVMTLTYFDSTLAKMQLANLTGDQVVALADEQFIVPAFQR